MRRQSVDRFRIREFAEHGPPATCISVPVLTSASVCNVLELSHRLQYWFQKLYYMDEVTEDHAGGITTSTCPTFYIYLYHVATRALSESTQNRRLILAETALQSFVNLLGDEHKQ